MNEFEQFFSNYFFTGVIYEIPYIIQKLWIRTLRIT